MPHAPLLTGMIVAVALAGCAPKAVPSAASPHPTTTQAAASPDVTVMTFNLRFASPRPPNAWPQRRDLVRDAIRSVDADLIGTQEGLYGQLKDVEADLGGDYAWIGHGRDGGSRGEFMAVFYRKARFEPLEYEHFWLSDTPSVIGSATWGHTNRRMVTWVRFLDRRTNKEFEFWNTHLDHAVQPAREKAAALIRQRIEARGTSRPIVLLGDFNAAAKTNRAYEILTDGGFLRDTWTGDEAGTFHDFTGTPGNQGRIDWILLRGAVAPVGPTEIVRYQRDGRWPSDHFPVAARVRM
jgi:endonuclease/exonuclease/phosphatase family metal-dependent hydrolase